MAGPVLLTLLLRFLALDLGPANDMLLFLSLTVAAALLGGLLPALASAAVGSLLLNWFLTKPYGTMPPNKSSADAMPSRRACVARIVSSGTKNRRPV